MIAANLPVQRPSNAKVLIVDGRGHIKQYWAGGEMEVNHTSDPVVIPRLLER